MVKNLSGDTQPRPESSATRSQQSASAWAGTEAGRRAFRYQFRFDQKEAFELDEAGEPLDYINSLAGVSRKLQQGEDFPLWFTLDDHTHPLFNTGRDAYDQADRIRQAGYDAAITDNWEALERFCVDVRLLRDMSPPAGEDAWAAILNRGRPPPQAMPRAFLEMLPRTFGTILSASLAPSSPTMACTYTEPSMASVHLTRRQKRCLTTRKTVQIADPSAILPVITTEWRASRDDSDSEQAHGQTMYSAVQGAGIFQNCQLSVKVLMLCVGFGWAQPWASSWPGKDSSFDVQLVRGEEIDLGTLKGAISCMLMP
ncbi:hypothetical protein GGX14DRAFT_409071, partial [Mycena pura]